MFSWCRILNAAGGLANFPAVKDGYETMLADGIDSPYLLSYLVDFYEEDLEKNGMNQEHAKRAIEVKLLSWSIYLLKKSQLAIWALVITPYKLTPSASYQYPPTPL